MLGRSPFLVVTALGLAASGLAAELDQIRERGTLRVIVWSDNLPELFAGKPGTAPGFEREVLDGFARLQRLKLEVVPVPGLDDRIPALLKQQGDLVAGGLVNTESRRKLVHFTSEVFPIRHLAMTRKPRGPVPDLARLRAERIGTIKGSSWAEEIQKAGVPAGNVVDSFTSADALMAGLRAGTVSAVVMSAVWAIVEQRKDPELQIGILMGAPTSLGFAVPKDAPQLRAALDTYIDDFRHTTSWSRLVVKYFGTGGLEILRKSREN